MFVTTKIGRSNNQMMMQLEPETILNISMNFSAYNVSNATELFSSVSVGLDKFRWVSSHNDPIPEEEWPRLDNQTCLDQGSPAIPSVADPFLRAPAALLIGTMKGGTSALISYLREHPQVITTKRKELHFYDFGFHKYATTQGITRRDARDGYRKMFGETNNLTYDEMKEQPRMVAIDDSPRYMFQSDRVPARVLCVSPWVKLLAVLRNPVDRAYSQFVMMDPKGKSTRTFEEWIDKDFADLREKGVIETQIPRDKFAGSDEEMSAWKAYTRLTSNAPIGRGLYAIQLRHWFQIYEANGKSRDDFMIIQSERFRVEKSGIYREVLKFLGLDEFELTDEVEYNKQRYQRPMAEQTRKMLEEFYAPYNKQLYELLGDQWDGVWDPKDQ